MQKLLICLVLLTFLSCKKDTPPPQIELPLLSSLTALDELVPECSGLALTENFLWAHNDSGGEPVLYKIDASTGEVVLTKTVANGVNVDWEELTLDNEFLYVGDVGNNKGMRMDQLIYKISLDQLHNSDEFISATGFLSFSYENQVDFSNQTFHNFDCEALIQDDENLYLFTKNRANSNTNLYSINKTDPFQDAILLDSIPVNGLITGADWSADKRYIALLGYKVIVGNPDQFEDFIEIITLEAGQLTKVETVEIPLEEQAEGICHIRDNLFYVGSEKEGQFGGNVVTVNLSPYVTEL